MTAAVLSPARAESLRRVRWAEETLREVTAKTRAEVCGMSLSYYCMLRSDDPDGSRQRERRTSYRGVCADCGAATRSDGTSRPSSRCAACGLRQSARTNQARRGSGPTQQRVLAALREAGDLRFMDLAAASGTTKEVLSATLNRLRRYGIVERVARGRYRIALEQTTGPGGVSPEETNAAGARREPS